MKELISKVSQHLNLTRDEAASAMRTIMRGEATDPQIGAFLVALRMKGEQTEELLGFIDVMRELGRKIKVDDPGAIDLCGTGGDNAGTFNISTVSSFVVAGAGITVAKHGNRSISSSCGSADVLKALGVNIESTPERTEKCINTIGIGFLFAPIYYPAMKYAAKARAEIGVKTCFNMLGPLANPAGVRRQLVGAFDGQAAARMASTFSHLNCERVLVVHAEDGLDEISLNATTNVYDVTGSQPPRSYPVKALSFGLGRVNLAQIKGSNAADNATIAMSVLRGERSPYREVVVANAAFGIIASGKRAEIIHAVTMAQESIDSGAALNKLNQLIELSNADPKGSFGNASLRDK